MRIILSQIKIQEAIRFMIVGVFATFLHYLLYLLFNIFLINWISYSLGYCISFLFNFYLSSNYTFHSKANIKKCIGFGICHSINYCLHIALLFIFLNMRIPDEYAPIPVFCIAIPINFLLVRYVFKSKRLS